MEGEILGDKQVTKMGKNLVTIIAKDKVLIKIYVMNKEVSIENITGQNKL